MRTPTIRIAVLCMGAALLRAEPLRANEALDAEALNAAITTLLDNHPAARRTNIALKVVDLESGTVLFDRNGDRRFTPASNLKIYTAAAALDLLGPDHRWTTQVDASVPDGLPAARDGVVHGSIVFEGGGDPMLSGADLADLADRLVHEAGITKVEGAVLVDHARSFVADDPASIPHPWDGLPDKGPGWMWDDEPDYYNMTITPLMVDFNVLEVVVEPAPAGERPLAFLHPASDVPSIRNTAITAAHQGELAITRQPFQDDILVTGTIGEDAPPTIARITMNDPSAWIAGLFTDMLRQRGVKVERNPARTKPTARTRRVSLITHEGKTLAEAVRHFLKVSENAIGEMLLLTLAERFSERDAGTPSVNWPTGATVIRDWLVNEAGLDPESFRLVDGSGLSRYNLISPDSAIRLLKFMHTHQHHDAFFDGLVVYDVKLAEPGGGGGVGWGGGAEKFDGIPLVEFDTERVFAKPGGMSGVSTISGYIRTLDGRWLAFSFLTNGTIGSNAPVRSLRDAIWSELVRYRPAHTPVSP